MLAIHTAADTPAGTAAPSPEAAFSWGEIVAPVEPFLRMVSRRLATQVETFEPEIASLARYALSSQGKQLRPALVGLSGEAVGTLGEDHVTAATIIEMVHLATLVHDDVMDDAAMRRRRPTLAVQCGTATSVLLGDTLFAHALLLAAGFPTPDVCRMVAAATKVVCTGEIIQTHGSARLDMSRDEYFRILRMKTAELFALSCELGARLAGAGPEEQQALRDYGLALGTAYQVYDDCVDLFGDEARAGKSLGTDLLGGKLTLPLLVGLERARGTDRRRLERILTQWQPELMGDLRTLLRQTEALGESAAVIADYCRLAREAMHDLPPSAGRRALAWTTEFLARQTEELATSARG